MQIQAHKTLFNILRNNKSNNITKTKHAWTLQEEQICVQLYIDLYIKNKSSTEIIFFIVCRLSLYLFFHCTTLLYICARIV